MLNHVVCSFMVCGMSTGNAPAHSRKRVSFAYAGTQYEMGFAYGQLMKQEINSLLPQVMAYMDAQINQSIPAYIPANIREAIIEYGLPYALNLTYEFTKRKCIRLSNG
jgi:hypothetical protein